MIKNKKRIILSLLLVAFLVLGLTSSSSAASVSTHELTIMGTTDMHQNLMSYDYMGDEEVEDFGFSKTYTLIEEIRSNNENTILLSNGDIISGSLISTVETQVDPLKEGETQRIVEIYNEVGYDAVTVGNHELQDYKMSFFEKAKKGAEFPWLSSNIKMAENPEKNYVKPYTIVDKNIDGKELKVGVIGFTPPQTMRWGSSHLKGNVVMEDIVNSAMNYMPELKEKTDIIVALAHTGISDKKITSYDARENAAYYLAQIDGIDAMILGHHHQELPGGYKGITGIDSKKGTIHGVPAVMPQSWGSALGVIDLDLAHINGEWNVQSASTRLEKVNKNVKDSDKIKELAKDIHEKTIAYVRQPIGTTERDITSYVSRVMDSSVTQIINEAQIWWAKNEFEDGEYSDLPILSAAAPFQAGRENPEYFTEVWEGDVTIGDVTDLYIYANQIRVMKINGNQVVEWLERSAENFNQIDPDASGTQELLNSEFSAYNYDVIEGIEYEIDVTKPKGERIVNATYKGEALSADQEFLVVTNDYRAGGGGNFPPCVEENPVYAPSGETNRAQIIDYIKAKETVNTNPTNNWRIKPVDIEGTVTFRSHPEAKEYMEKYNFQNVEYLKTDENGMGVYEINLSE